MLKTVRKIKEEKKMNYLESFIGQEVQLFPGDTYYKYARLLEINEYGYVFKITRCANGCEYRVGDTVFFNHSCNVEFKK